MSITIPPAGTPESLKQLCNLLERLATNLKSTQCPCWGNEDGLDFVEFAGLRAYYVPAHEFTFNSILGAQKRTLQGIAVMVYQVFPASYDDAGCEEWVDQGVYQHPVQAAHAIADLWLGDAEEGAFSGPAEELYAEQLASA